jgi:pyrrolidone-carboxylate peptidase
MDVCVYMCVCMSGHNSGTPAAISTKLGTYIAICMCKNLMYVLYIFRREDGVGGREFG